jgi:hypothetical protein
MDLTRLFYPKSGFATFGSRLRLAARALRAHLRAEKYFFTGEAGKKMI